MGIDPSGSAPRSGVEVKPDPTRGPWWRGARRPDGLIEIELSGALPAEWSLNLTRALACGGASLRGGYARRIEPDAWLARLEIEWQAGPLPLDLLALASRRHDPPPPPEPRILDFELHDLSAHDGSLALELHAWDSVGLLAAVLGRVHANGLVPVELILETEEDCAFHHLALIGHGGRLPGPRQRRGLSQGLAGLLGGR